MPLRSGHGRQGKVCLNAARSDLPWRSSGSEFRMPAVVGTARQRLAADLATGGSVEQTAQPA